MEYTLDRLHRQAREAILATGLVPAEHIELVAPKPNIPADVAFPTFKAAREKQLPPPQFAQQLAAAITLPSDGLLQQVVAAGPFVNFSIDTTRYIGSVLAAWDGFLQFRGPTRFFRQGPKCVADPVVPAV